MIRKDTFKIYFFSVLAERNMKKEMEEFIFKKIRNLEFDRSTKSNQVFFF